MMWPLGVLAIAGTLIATRLLWIFPMSAVMQRRRGVGPFSWRVPAVLTWAGTRGVMPLAAALSIPLTAADGQPLQHRSLVLVLTTGVVVLTLVLQGFTLAPVVRASGIALEPTTTAREEAQALDRLARAGLARLEQVADVDAAPEVVVEQLRRDLHARLDHASAVLDEAQSAEHTLMIARRELRQELIRAEELELSRLYEERQISDTTRRRIQRGLDLEEAGLEDSD
jgi:CPA1 family monovalent cation:H+ antiporter